MGITLSLCETAVTLGSAVALAEHWISEVEVLANLSISSETVTVPVPLLGNRVSYILAST